MSRTFALFTKTYVGDTADFAKLCASIDRHMPDVTHYVLVDHSDYALFEHYASDRRKVIDCKTILPQFIEINLPGRRIWWRFPLMPVRGWIYQQLIKIGFSATLEEDAVVVVDSDVIFHRALAEDDVFEGSRVKFFRAPGRGDGPQHQLWNRIAQRCLGVPEIGYPGYDYIIPAIQVSPKVMRGMIARIEETTGKNWAQVLCGNFRFSEYVLYGTYCDAVPGPHQDLIAATEHGFCHCSWDYDLDDSAGMAAFLNGLEPRHACVVVQSNLGLSQEQRARIFDQLDYSNSEKMMGLHSHD
jgi:hypothetical protein